MQAVVDAARLQGWLVYHTHDSRSSAAGFPDLVMLRGAYMIVAELKVGKPGTVKGEPTLAQAEWLEAFERVVEYGEVAVWRPEDWPTIEQALA